MAHKPTPVIRKRIAGLLGEGVGRKEIAKRIGISYNVLKKYYRKELGLEQGVEAAPLQEVEKYEVTPIVAKPIKTTSEPSEHQEEELVYVRNTIGTQSAGNLAFHALINRVQNGTKETTIHYEYTKWDNKGKPVEKKPLGYSEKFKPAPTRDVELLIGLTTDLLTFKEQEFLRIQKEVHNIKDDTEDSKKAIKYDYSKLSNEKIETLKEILSEAIVKE